MFVVINPLLYIIYDHYSCSIPSSNADKNKTMLIDHQHLDYDPKEDLVCDALEGCNVT
jgi:hypothetical protein